MTRRTSFILTCALVVLALATPPLAAESNQEVVDDAVSAAESWLTLVDTGKYAESWEESAELFKGAITSERWVQALNATRKPLGDLVSRKVETTQHATSLPGAPDGEYVVIQFTTSFANKKSAVETVTPMKHPDGSWRVSGYYVK